MDEEPNQARTSGAASGAGAAGSVPSAVGSSLGTAKVLHPGFCCCLPIPLTWISTCSRPQVVSWVVWTACWEAVISISCDTRTALTSRIVPGTAASAQLCGRFLRRRPLRHALRRDLFVMGCEVPCLLGLAEPGPLLNTLRSPYLTLAMQNVLRIARGAAEACLGQRAWALHDSCSPTCDCLGICGAAGGAEHGEGRGGGGGRPGTGGAVQGLQQREEPRVRLDGPPDGRRGTVTLRHGRLWRCLLHVLGLLIQALAMCAEAQWKGVCMHVLILASPEQCSSQGRHRVNADQPLTG